MTVILYEVHDVVSGDVIGRITGQQLRDAAGVGRNTPVFNGTLVEQFNSNKQQAGEPERLRTVVA